MNLCYRIILTNKVNEQCICDITLQAKAKLGERDKPSSGGHGTAPPPLSAPTPETKPLVLANPFFVQAMIS